MVLVTAMTTEAADHDPFPPIDPPAGSAPARPRASSALPGAIAGSSSQPATHLSALRSANASRPAGEPRRGRGVEPPRFAAVRHGPEPRPEVHRLDRSQQGELSLPIGPPRYEP